MNDFGASINPRKTLVREEILSRAADVFDRSGFAQTRMQDIAQELSLSRSALYHYFASKEDILAALVAEHTQIRAEVLVAYADDKARSPADRLRDALRSTIGERLAGGSRLRVLDQLVRDMPPGMRADFDRGRRHILDVYTRIIVEGIASGAFRDVDPRMAALAVLGIASWTSWWYSPSGRRGAGELTEMLIDLALHSVLATGDGSVDRGRVFAEIRERLDLLEGERRAPSRSKP